MRTAIKGLLALAAFSAAISITVIPTFAQTTGIDEPAPQLQTTEFDQAETQVQDAQLEDESAQGPAPVPVEVPSVEVQSESSLYGEPEAVPLGTFKTSAYALRGPMRSGRYTYYGAVAVDPRVIPLGSTLYIEGLGYFVAEDTGGAVHGNHIDIWFSTRYEAIQYGLQPRRAWLVA